MSQLRRSFIAAAGLVLTGGPGFADDTGFASIHSKTKSGGRTCFSDHFHAGHGTGATKPQALQAALRDWWSYTAGEYGSDWAHWGKSASKAIQYSKADAGWSVTVESRPCK